MDCIKLKMGDKTWKCTSKKIRIKIQGVINMTFDDITIKQFENRYVLVHSLGYQIMVVDFPRDGQFFLDAKVLSTISKALSLRWKQTSTSKENKLASFVFFGLNVIQTEPNGYAIYLPYGQQIVMVYFPLDNNYIDDDKCLKIICKALALRYGIK